MVAQLDPTYLKISRRQSLFRLLTAALFEGRPLTTKGRWANRFIIVFLESVARIFGSYANYHPIFIVGLGRSGTTILGKILSMHPNVGFLNEPKLIWTLSNQADDIIGNYRICAGRFRHGRFDASSARKRRHRRFIGAYARLLGCSAVVDKYPECIYRVEYLREIWPESRFLGIIRNGNAVINSVARWNERHARREGNSIENWWGKEDRKWRCLVEQIAVQHPAWKNCVKELLAVSDQRERAAVEWTLAAREMSALQEHSPNMDSMMIVKFEDLVSHKSRLVESLLDFCELSSNHMVKAYADAVIGESKITTPAKLPSFVQQPFDEMMECWGYR